MTKPLYCFSDTLLHAVAIAVEDFRNRIDNKEKWELESPEGRCHIVLVKDNQGVISLEPTESDKDFSKLFQ